MRFHNFAEGNESRAVLTLTPSSGRNPTPTLDGPLSTSYIFRLTRTIHDTSRFECNPEAISGAMLPRGRILTSPIDWPTPVSDWCSVDISRLSCINRDFLAP